MGKWTQEQHDKLVALVAADLSWSDIGERLGKSCGACQVYYSKRVRNGEFSKRNLHRECAPDLTPAQIEEATRIRERGPRGRMNLRRVAKIMGVREIQLLRIFNPKEIARQRRRDDNRAYERVMPTVIPPEVLEERDRAFQPMSPTREILGDPRPGRSALDKRRAA